MKTGLIIFDLDGTLLNTIDDIANCANFVLSKNGFQTHQVNDYKKFIGEGTDKIILNSIPDNYHNRKEQISKIISEYYECYSQNCLKMSSLYKGINEELNCFLVNGFKLAVFSNKADLFVHKCVSHYFKAGIFDMVLGSKVELKRKPAPDGLNLIRKTLQTDVANCIYVGDSVADAQAAKNAKMKFIGVSWGYQNVEDLIKIGVAGIAENPNSLLKVILTL